MEKRAPKLAIVVGLLLVNVYLGNHLVSGEHGLVAWRDLQKDVALKQDQLDQLKREQQSLGAAISGLRASAKSPDFDRDLLEERAKAVLGVTHSDEFVVYVDRFLKNN